jgi:hypothetical protein
MNFDAMARIEQVMGRINQIQTQIQSAMGTTAPPAPVSFQNMLLEKLQPPPQMNMSNLPYGMPPGMNPMGIGFINPFNNFNLQNQFQQIAAMTPERILSIDGTHTLQAQTAAKFKVLEQYISARFPGRKVTVTSTMDGRHSSPAHPAGKAVDFVVEGLTKDESRVVEDLCRQAGFRPYNEYIHGSTYKTGDHMHIELEGA